MGGRWAVDGCQEEVADGCQEGVTFPCQEEAADGCQEGAADKCQAGPTECIHIHISITHVGSMGGAQPCKSLSMSPTTQVTTLPLPTSVPSKDIVARLTPCLKATIVLKWGFPCVVALAFITVGTWKQMQFVWLLGFALKA